MKAAIIAEAAGSPHALAMTSFVGALAEGFGQVGVASRVIVLAESETLYRPDSLGSCESSAPWMLPPRPRARDLLEAARAGVGDRAWCADGRRAPVLHDWYRELLLEREIAAFMGDETDGAILVYPRILSVLDTCVRIGHRLGLPVVAFSTEALSDSQIDPATRDQYVACVVDCCSGIWAISDHLGSFWRGHGFCAERVHRSVGPVRDSFFADGEGGSVASSGAFIGNLAHREVEHLLEIVDRVRQRVPAFRLTIHGDALDARRAELSDAVAQGGLADAVTISPAVSPPDVPSVLRRAEVLLLPRARGEFSTAGFPNKLGEYLASGRPVVVTAVGDIPKYLRDGTDALLVEPGDDEAFAEAVARVLTDPALAASLGAAGRAVAERLFRASVVAAGTADFLGGLLPTAAHSPAEGSGRRWFRRCAFVCRELVRAARRGVARSVRRFRPESLGSA